MSSVLPAANGIIARIGRVGQACAHAAAGSAGVASAAPAKLKELRRRRHGHSLVVSLVRAMSDGRAELPLRLRAEATSDAGRAFTPARNRHLVHLHAERHRGVVAEQHQHLGDALAADAPFRSRRTPRPTASRRATSAAANGARRARADR